MLTWSSWEQLQKSSFHYNRIRHIFLGINADDKLIAEGQLHAAESYLEDNNQLTTKKSHVL